MLKKITDFFDGLFNAVELIPVGLYSQESTLNGEAPYKMHLRVEPDGSGILILNASTVLHLNQTAVEYAYNLIEGKENDEIAAIVASRYDIPITQAEKDLDAFLSRITTLLESEDLDPVSYLDLERVIPYSQSTSAPYRLDCALTYQVSEGMDLSDAPADRVDRELSTAEWKQILHSALEAGIPHIIFTGGEPTLRDDLIELINETENLGLVSGLLTDGLRFSEKKFTSAILQSGLDHIMLLCQPEDERFWKALKNLMPEDIAVTVHVTIDSNDNKQVKKTIERLAENDVTKISLSSVDENFSDTLAYANDLGASLGMKPVWDLPVPYSSFNPVALELRADQEKTLDGAGKAWLYVEPDGDVLPSQGINKVMGNMLTDPWKKIWKNR